MSMSLITGVQAPVRRRFAILAALLAAFVVAGVVSLPFLQHCCRDAHLPAWPDPPSRTLLDRLFFMDMAPRLAALATAAGTIALVGLAAIYVITAEVERRELEGRSSWFPGFLRGTVASFVVGVFYLYGLFVTGYFQLGLSNLIWIIGIPVLFAALAGRNEFERHRGGIFLIVPGFLFEIALMMALGIDS